jgi:MATE family multidrug resistance protein
LSGRSLALVELRAQAALAAPMALVYAGQQLTPLVSTAFVGRLDATHVAAYGLTQALFNAFLVLGLGTMMGLDPLISQALGAGNPSRARALLWQGGWLALLTSVVLAGPVIGVRHFLGLMGIDDVTAGLTRDCLLVRTLSIPPLLLFIGTRSYLSAVGRTRPLVAAVVLCNAVNVPVTALLVFGGSRLPAWAWGLQDVPALGLMGAVWAITVVPVLQLVVVGLFLVRLHREEPLVVRRRPDREDLRQAVRVGLPIGIQAGAEVGVFAVVGVLAGGLGATYMAAHQVALVVASFSFATSMGLGVGGAVRVGKAVGARDQEGTRRAGLVAFAGGGTFMAACGVAMLLLARPLARLFTNIPEVQAVTVPLIGIAAFFQVSDGVQAVGAGVLRGAGDTRFLSVTNVVAHYGLGLPVALLCAFPLGMGVTGLWWGLCTGLSAVAVTLFIRFWWLSARGIQPLEPHAPT